MSLGRTISFFFCLLSYPNGYLKRPYDARNGTSHTLLILFFPFYIMKKMSGREASYSLWQAKPARRVYIAKASGKLRPLSIPVIIDRCLQSMVKNALEPAWEARFEGSSYGFRPGRSCHDAIEKIYELARPNKTKSGPSTPIFAGRSTTSRTTICLRPLAQFLARNLSSNG